MISPISFGSVYKIRTTDNSSINHQFNSIKINEFCKKRNIPYFETSQYVVKYPIKNTKYSITTTLFPSDNKDADMESFLANKGIQYTKYKTEDIMRPQEIIKRVKQAPDGYKTYIIDSEKLEQILLTQEDNNFKSTKKIYKDEHKKETQLMLKSMDKIPASTLHLTTWFNTDETIEHIKNNGAPEENSIVFNFENTTDEPDNCMYFAMKGAGMKDIPVYLDDVSSLVANALGIIKEVI